MFQGRNTKGLRVAQGPDSYVTDRLRCRLPLLFQHTPTLSLRHVDTAPALCRRYLCISERQDAVETQIDICVARIPELQLSTPLKLICTTLYVQEALGP